MVRTGSARVRALAAVAVAAVRVSLLDARRAGLDEMVRHLRSGAPYRGALRDPDLLAETVERWLHRLPPTRSGPCVRRSLVLLHCLARCGLEPVLHIGASVDPSGRAVGHMWLTCRGRSGAPADGFEEIVSL